MRPFFENPTQICVALQAAARTRFAGLGWLEYCLCQGELEKRLENGLFRVRGVKRLGLTTTTTTTGVWVF